MTAERLAPALCVIGAGRSGRALAADAAAAGQSVVLVEKGPMDGTQSVERVHMQALLATAHRAQAMRASGSLGLRPVEPRVDWRVVRERAAAVAAESAPLRSAVRFRALGVTVIQASARFKDPKVLEAGDVSVRARRFVVATGAGPAIPGLPGLETVRFLTPDTLLSLDGLPSHLVILGANAAALEIGQTFRRLGSLVTILAADRALPAEDPELAEPVLKRLGDEGVVIRTGAAVGRIEPGHGGSVHLSADWGGKTEWFAGSHLLIAAGRHPRVEALGLDAAGVRYSAGGIAVGTGFRTSNRRICAIGSVMDGPRDRDGGRHQAAFLLRRGRFGSAKPFPARAVPRVVRTDPELATVGLDETEARELHKQIRIVRAPLGDTERARTDGIVDGHIKIIATPDGHVLGAAIVGAGAADLLTPWSLAVAGKLRVDDLADALTPSFTLSEVSRDAALQSGSAGREQASVLRVSRLLRPFG